MKMDRRRVFVGFYEIVEDIYIFDRIIFAIKRVFMYMLRHLSSLY